MAHRILIADDEPNIVISLEFMMQREGYEVSIARDGRRQDFQRDVTIQTRLASR